VLQNENAELRLVSVAQNSDDDDDDYMKFDDNDNGGQGG
jgi:hypothetical protein